MNFAIKVTCRHETHTLLQYSNNRTLRLNLLSGTDVCVLSGTDVCVCFFLVHTTILLIGTFYIFKGNAIKISL